MIRPEKPSAADLDLYYKVKGLAARFYTQKQAAEILGYSSSELGMYAKHHDIKFRKGKLHYDLMPRGEIDNICRDAFRKVMGRCPIRDESPYGERTVR